MEKLKMQTRDLADENLKKLAALFPNAVTIINGKAAIDVDVLRQEISGEIIEGPTERYQFTWPDKRKSIVLANQATSKTLRPDMKKSSGKDGKPGNFDSGNICIEGDNLDALKILRETYLGKVKMIYIDPPYNTGNDFIYDDDFALENYYYQDNSGQYDVDGMRLVPNLESNGRFHTDWLNMIYPRLRIARDFLSDDGVIFISIDDNEQANLKKICDEIFGERNFLVCFPRVTKKGGKSTETYAKNHDYVLGYCKNNSYVEIFGLAHTDKNFKYRDEFFDKRGFYKLNQPLDYNSLQYSESMDFIINIDGKIYVPGGDLGKQKLRHEGQHGSHDWVWRWSKEKFDFGYKNGWIVITENGRIYTKTYLKASIGKDSNGKYFIAYDERTKAISTLETTENLYSNDNSTKEFQSLMGKSLFEYAKPSSLVKLFLKTSTSPDSIILDFFSGSATTAHAVMKLNAEDGGKRKFILVQIPESTPENSEARKAGYENICEIGEERIRRAAAKIREDYPIAASEIDLGFRVFRVDSSNMKEVFYKPEDFHQGQLDVLADNIKEDRRPEDLLIQVMLELGVKLSAKIEEKIIAGKKIFSVDGNYLIACFDEKISDEVITTIAKQKPFYAAFRDSGMINDSVMTNFDQLFEYYSPATVRKIL